VSNIDLYNASFFCYKLFKQKVVELRDKVGKLKNEHKMASDAISKFIGDAPWPFNTVLGIVWDGIEKQDDSAAKMLQILEKIESSNEEGFRQIEQKMSKLIETGAKTEDMRKLGEEIRTSSESVVSIIDKMLEEIMMRNYRNYGAIFELATNMTSFLSTPSQQHRKVLQMMKDDLVLFLVYMIALPMTPFSLMAIKQRKK
jgi:hypothetical protein